MRFRRVAVPLACLALVVVTSASSASGNGRVAYIRAQTLYTSLPDGSGEREIALDSTGTIGWSPDGSKIAFAMSPSPLGSFPAVVNADGSSPTQLASSGWWDPGCWLTASKLVAERSEIAADGAHYAHDLYLFDLTDHSERRLTTDGVDKVLGWQSCAPDGTAVAYTTFSGSGGSVYRVAADGSAPVRLTNEGDIYFGPPAWSPDGQELALGRFGQLYVVGADGSGGRVLTTKTFAYGPMWSPDGAELAFGYHDEAAIHCSHFGCSSGNGVGLISVDGTDERRVTDGTFDSGPATWSPDGTKIVFHSQRVDEAGRATQELLFANRDGTCPTRLPEDVWGNSWQPLPGAGPSPPLRCANLAISVSPDWFDARIRDIVTYTLTVRNAGNDSAAGTVVTQIQADGFYPVGARPSQGSCTLGSDPAVRCALGTLPAGAAATITIEVRVPLTGNFATLVRATTASGDSDPDDNHDDVGIHVWDCTVLGLPGNDVLRGTPKADVICGRGGSDSIDGLAGADILLGNSGDDVITGGSGKDVVNGGAGNDVIRVRDRARDQVTCGPGHDVVIADRFDRVARDCERVSRYALAPR